jgi:phage terminase large subunit
MKLGKIWLPHDAKVKTFQSKHSSIERFLAGFGPSHVGIVPMSRKSDQISAARAVIDRCAFAKDACEDGLDGLRAWEFEWNDDTNVFSKEPNHNWASHPSDAYAYGCQVMESIDPPPPMADTTIRGITVGNNKVTLDEMWASVPKHNGRI